MNKDLIRIIAIVIIISVSLLCFSLTNSTAIKIWYKLAGGESQKKDVEDLSLESMMIKYNEHVENYYRYHSSDNKIQQRWAENSKITANDIAVKYNDIVGENILKIIGG